MEIVAYTLTGCPSCRHLKKLFERANVEYKEIILKKDMSLEEFASKYPEVENFPFVVIDGKIVGGIYEIALLFVQKGLVSSKK